MTSAKPVKPAASTPPVKALAALKPPQHLMVDYCLRLLRMTNDKKELERVLGVVLAKLREENRLDSIMGVLDQMTNAINRYHA